MLTLKNIKKDYPMGTTTVHALKGVSLGFRNSEFVSILGPSGCGKTTMLNIIGGLDRYTEGDLVINGVSTKNYTDGDWDTYRNHTIGFVFQTYNLIMHQTVLGNVELALTLSGVSAKERRELAVRALERVGLGAETEKKPNQLSGGQMQRVAIARAIVNNPDIILADEPTGALDTATSVQIMDILKEISKSRLVVMVTHNPELAEKYSTRIVRLSDGEIISDSNPVSPEEYAVLAEEAECNRKCKDGEYEGEDCYSATITAEQEQKPPKTHKNRKKRKARPSMSFTTALSLSLKNLLTKKARTTLVAVAGSIGIIGIALILSLSSGFQLYINKVEEDTLSSYPLAISRETMDMSAMVSTLAGISSNEEFEKESGVVYSNRMMYKLLAAMNNRRVVNELNDFNEALVSDENLKQYINTIRYTYDFDIPIFLQKNAPLNKNGRTVQVNPSNMFSRLMPSMGGITLTFDIFSELLDNEALLDSQYDFLCGNKWPTEYDEVVIVVNRNEEIEDYALYSLGLLDPQELNSLLASATNPSAGSSDSEEESKPPVGFTYEDLMGLEFKAVPAVDFYTLDESDVFPKANEKNTVEKEEAIDGGITLKVVGVVRPKPASASASISGTVGYSSKLTQEIIRRTCESPIIKAQLAKKGINIFTGEVFQTKRVDVTIDRLKGMLSALAGSDNSDLADTINTFIDRQIKKYVEEGRTQEQAEQMVLDEYMQYLNIDSGGESLEQNYYDLGYATADDYMTISIYAKDFEGKNRIISWINDYNTRAQNSGNPQKVINYTDYVGIMMTSITDIINAISYVLIGFVAISLIVSSIMIGVITYISVIERTKEIGILRSIGASKKDISRVFNAETFIIGLGAGVFGVLVAVLLDIPINIILALLAGLNGIAAVPWWGAIALVLISVGLTLIAGLIPASFAARKDPVVALRTE